MFGAELRIGSGGVAIILAGGDGKGEGIECGIAVWGEGFEDPEGGLAGGAGDLAKEGEADGGGFFADGAPSGCAGERKGG